MSKAYAKTRAEEKKKNSSASSQQSSYEKSVQIYNQQKELDIQAAKRASENFTRASTYNQYNSNLRAYMDRLNALRGYGYNTSTPMAQVQQEIKRIQPDLQQENRYMQALQEQRDLERRKREARNSQPWAVRVGLVDPNEAEMTFGVYDPPASERGRVSNVLAAGGKGWLAGLQNALGFALDPSQPDEAEMFFGKAPTSKLGEKISGKINEALFNQSQRLYGASDELNRQALEHETAAKKGLGKFGQTLVDVGMAGTQMALDAGIGAATGTGMASMGTRTFGQSAREALDSGATYQQAMDYGALSAAVELGTEKMFDVAKIFGGGGLDKAIEKWIVKYAKTPAGMTILRTIAGASGEGLEEIISSAVNPLLRSGYDPNALQDYKDDNFIADMLHEGLVGALLGGVGVAGNVITGGNARMVNEVNQEALNQRLQRADAFNAAQRNLFAGNTMQTGTADAEAARVLARNSGTQGARDRAAVRTAAREQYGKQAKAVESVFEAGTADAETFRRQFQTAYDLGKEGAALDVVMNTPATADLNKLQRENAWLIGRDAGIREGTIKEEANENGEAVRVRRGGERDAGQSSAGSVQQMEGSAGSYQEGRSLGIGGDAKDSGAAGFLYSDKVKSLRDYGVKNGAVIKNLYELSEDSYEAAGLMEVKKEAEAHGYKLVAVSGLLHTQDAPGGWVTQSRGMVDEDTKTMFVQVDNVRFTASQIARHEDSHTKIDQGEISLKATKEAVEKALSPEEYHQALQDYADAYYGIDMTEEQAWVEIVCDAQGDMNIFEGLGERFLEQRERLGKVLETVKKATQETAQEGGKRAPPEGGQKFSRELDDRYMQAVQSGDVEAAQRMVDEAAKAAGYDTKAYHGTQADFTVFDKAKIGSNTNNKGAFGFGFYFSNNPNYAAYYNRKDGKVAKDGSGRVINAYLKIKNPFRWNSINTREKFDSFVKEFNLRGKIGWNKTLSEPRHVAGTGYEEALTEALQSKGYDGVVYRFHENGGDTSEYVVFEPEQIKSADPVTYDDDGNIVPLSERFNSDETDIRYSRETDIDQLARENRALQKETDELRKAVQKWKGETKRTTRATLREQDVRKAAKQMLKDYSSKADAESVGAKLRQLGELIMNGENGEAAHWTDVRALAEEIAEEIVNAESVNVNGDEFENFQLLTGVLKEKPIHVSEADLSDILAETGYETIGAFNKAYRGTVRITTEAAKAGDKTAQDAYYEMVEAMPGWFPEDVSEAEYVPRMLEVLEGLKPIYGMSEQTSANYEAAVTWAANDVIDRVLDESIRQNPKTFADRAQAKYDKERARLYQRIREVREQGNERVERTKREYTERSRKAIERMQARQEREIQKLKDRQREVRQNERERRGVTATWHKIQKLGASFRQMVEHPAQAATKHAPRELAKALQGVADVFYTENRKRSNMTVNAAIQNLIVQFDALKDSDQGIYYDPMLAELNRAAEKNLLNIPANQMTSEQVNAVYRMLKAHMKNITNANKFVTGKWAKGIWETGRDWSREVDGASPVMKGWTGDFLNWQLRPDSFFKRISGFVKDSVGERVQKMFSDGTEKMLRIQQDAYYTFRKFTESKDFDKLSKRGKKDLVDVGLKDADGKPVLLTRDMMLAVYMNLRNEQNLQAATFGGIEVPNFDEYYTGKTSTSYRHRTTTANVGGDTLELRNEQHDLQKALREGELTGDAAQEAQARLAEITDEIQKRAEEITGQMIRVRSNIANMLTEYEKEFTETAAAWMQKSADYLNAETMAMYGIEKAQVPNYWPLHRDLTFVNTDLRTVTDEINLENVGFLKERVQSSAPIMLAGFTFELENHTRRVSEYCGFAAVQRDFNKLYNTKLTREGSSLERKIRDKFGDEQRKMGASAQQYIDSYIEAVSGADKSDATALSLIRRNLPRATLSLNLRVAVSQLASMPTAAAEIGWGSVVKGLPRGLKIAFSKKAKNELAQKSPWFWQRYRGEGGMREFADMHEAQNWFDRFYNKAASLPVMRNLLNWCQDFDVFATASMWAMSEEWVKSNTDLQPGTEEFDRAVGEKYADVIRKTQPNYTVTERSGLLRDKREGYKFLTMYKTQSNQNLNVLYDANATLMKYKRDLKNGANGVTKADVKAAERQFARAYTAVILGGSVTFAVLRAGANAILHAMNSYRDDDDELSVESVLNGILKETVGAISGMFAFGSEIEELIMAAVTGDKYWGLSDSAISAVSDIVERGYKLTQGDASGEDWEKFIKSLTNVLGVPYGNTKTVVSGFVNHVKDIQNGEFLSFEAGVNRTAKQETNRILNGYLNGEGDRVKKAWSELVELKDGDESKAQEAMRDAIKEAYAGGEFTDKQALDMLKRYGGKDGDDGKEYLLKWQSIQDIGVEPSKIDDAYRGGEISKKQALSALVKYKQMTQEDAQLALEKADFAEKYGFDYSEKNVQQAVVDGEITPDEAMKLWKKFGNQKDSHYESLLQQVEYMKKYPDVDPDLIGTQSSKDYEDYGKAAQIPAVDFFRYWQDIHDLQGNDKRSQGIAYIDALGISNDKKIALFLSFWAQSSLKYCPASWFD